MRSFQVSLDSDMKQLILAGDVDVVCVRERGKVLILWGFSIIMFTPTPTYLLLYLVLIIIATPTRLDRRIR